MFFSALKLLFKSKYVAEHVIDNHIRDKVIEPALGSILYTDLVLGTSEHSGVYIGNGKIVQLSGTGNIDCVSADQFMSGSTGVSIYVGCKDGVPVGAQEIAERANLYQKSIGSRLYNVILDNCHQFSASCILGKPDNENNFLWMLKHTCKKEMGVNEWRVWDLDAFSAQERTNETSDANSECLSAEEVERRMETKTKFLVELNKESIVIQKRLMDHLHGIPSSESRMATWENKQAELDKQADRIFDEMESLSREIEELEKLLPHKETA